MIDEVVSVKEVKLDASDALMLAIYDLPRVMLLQYLRPEMLIRWVDAGFDLILPYPSNAGYVSVSYIEYNSVNKKFSVHWVGKDGFDYHGDFEANLIGSLEVRKKSPPSNFH